MKLEQLRQKLLASARATAPDDHVPYAFEKRVRALLVSRALPDVWALWSRALWRASVPCLATVLILGATSFLSAGSGSTKAGSEEFSKDFEQTMLAAVDQSWEVW
jgi:hypothetical protein